MDTNLLYAAFRCRLVASFEVFQRLLHGEWRAVVSNHLINEYKGVLWRNADQLGLSLVDVALRPRTGALRPGGTATLVPARQLRREPVLNPPATSECILSVVHFRFQRCLGFGSRRKVCR